MSSDSKPQKPRKQANKQQPEPEPVFIAPSLSAWISVAETPPPVGHAVWLWDAVDEIGFIGWSMENEKGSQWWESAAYPPEWDAEKGEWNLCDDNFGNINPTHWMPLPLPPR